MNDLFRTERYFVQGLGLRGGGGVRWHQSNVRLASDKSHVPEMLGAFGAATY